MTLLFYDKQIIYNYSKMGSKKARKKKIKCEKESKMCKLRKLREKRVACSQFCEESYSDESFQCNEIYQNRLHTNNNSRFYTGEKGISKLSNFIEMREHYFAYLQAVVSQNCVFCSSKPSVDVLENLSLELEQQALLASLQADIYIQSISKIIKDIEKCTEEKQIYEEVKKFLTESSPNKNTLETVSGKSCASSQVPEIDAKLQDCAENQNKKPKMVDQCIETLNLYAENIGENQIICDNGDNSSVPISNYWCNPESHKNQSNFSTLEDVQNNSVENLQSSISVLKNSFSSPNFQTKQISKASSEMENEEVDPLLASLNQLQKSVELTLNNSEKVLKQKNEEKERAYIAQILEGDNSLDERFDSLSDNENDLKENVNEANLINRLDKMKELFGVEENGEIPKEKSKLPNYRLNHSNCRVRKPTIWKHEKVIQQYRFAMLSSEMSFSRQVLNKRLFLELFGDDSDEEHESEYRLHEKYRASCTERISSWVVKYLMPYYHDKRIIGRNIFKSLGHHISDVIVGKIQYPDEWTVKYFVSKFFPTKKKYACDADIFTFEFQ